MSVDYYTILGLDRSAPDELVDKAYRILARKHHPDAGAGSDADAFARIQQAYEALSETHRRGTYDAGLIEAEQSGRGGGHDLYQLLPLRFEQAAVGRPPPDRAGTDALHVGRTTQLASVPSV